MFARELLKKRDPEGGDELDQYPHPLPRYYKL